MKPQLSCLTDLSLEFYPNFLSKKTADLYFDSLHTQINWQQETYSLFGKQILSPRLTAWYGDYNAIYKYSGIVHQHLAWIPELIELKSRIEDLKNFEFNSALANLYRNGFDSMGYHSDNEPELGYEPIIASLSLGCSRKFYLKHKHNKALYKMNLSHGSLLIMSHGTQAYWQHAVPKQKRVHCPRINLTFRKIFIAK